MREENNMPSRVALSVGNDTSQRLDALRQVFPEAFTDGVPNLDMVAQLLQLSDPADQEKYSLGWAGKTDTIRSLRVQSTATLLPDATNSVKFDTAQNIFIEGDNLEVLRLLQRGYNDKVKLIYVDPPYNTKRDFVYKDDFTDSLRTYLEYSRQTDGDGNMTSATAEASGRRHSGWLSFMYPRLVLARNLLRNDGLIFVSIDDNEVHNLRYLMDGVFDQNNFIATLVWDRGVSQQQGMFTEYHEYILVYARNKAALANFSNPHGGEVEDRAIKKISRSNPASEFEFPAGVRCLATDGTSFSGEWGAAEKVKIVSGRFRVKDGKTRDKMTLSAGWAQRNQMEAWFAGNTPVFDTRGQEVIEFFFSSTGVPRYRKNKDALTPPTVQHWGTQSAASKELSNLLGGDYFDRPKPLKMIQDIIAWSTKNDDIVMDFFAGSATTAHAVMQQNALDGGVRRWVIVNLPEQTKKDSPAYKKGLKTVADICRLRLNKAAKAVGVKNFAIRCFKLAPSNFKLWDASTVIDDPDKIAEALTLFANTLMPGATNDGIAAEVLLKEGISPDTPWNRIKVAKEDIIVAGGTAVCLARTATPELVKGLLALKDIVKIIALDEAFHGHDKDKSNLAIAARKAGVEFRTV